MYKFLIILTLSIFILSYEKEQPQNTYKVASDTLKISGEKHLRNIKMLTFEGENAEAYFSSKEDKLIFQSTHGQYECDQIFTMDLYGQNKKLASTGQGRTTCAYFLPGDQKIIYASTHGAYANCPPKPDYSQGYVWKVYKEFDLYIDNVDGSDPKIFLPADGYDAEATVSPKGDRIVFTSMRNGDLDIYSVSLDGSELKQLTTTLGYDGGPFYSWDGSKIVYRSYHPKTDDEIKRYKDLLNRELIEPSNFQIMLMNADGSKQKQITHNDYANFAPFYHPDNKRIIFCSNLNSKNPHNPDFNLWMINENGNGLEQITFFEGFDGFPMFTHDGKKLVFDSNRFNRKLRDTNVFLAEWID